MVGNLVQWAVREVHGHHTVTVRGTGTPLLVPLLQPPFNPHMSSLRSTSQFNRRSIASSFSAAVDLLVFGRHDRSWWRRAGCVGCNTRPACRRLDADRCVDETWDTSSAHRPAVTRFVFPVGTERRTSTHVGVKINTATLCVYW